MRWNKISQYVTFSKESECGYKPELEVTKQVNFVHCRKTSKSPRDVHDPLGKRTQASAVGSGCVTAGMACKYYV